MGLELRVFLEDLAPAASLRGGTSCYACPHGSQSAVSPTEDTGGRGEVQSL